ncbi:JAB domain-containing protein [Commensalibacter oyaizuii]|uniref:DNA repair protein RadC n=1 Tax=Commensalibacter oyaizuii TaxID=3043873 RepID=A0ABT6PZ43_9PROT|nr:DNA repair protein RadC [Commensalibacter sp. TBRC 16381]MDI2090117.1 DNA repair protein RadC [Commensalibacter sp. TBRC 16381]
MDKSNESSFYIQINHKMRQRVKHAESDHTLLSLLSKWIKFDENISDWQNLTLSRFGSFPAILTANKDELQKSLNLSEKDSANIKLCYEVALRLLKAKIYNCDILKHKRRLINYLMAYLSRKQTEHFLLYFLDVKNQVIIESLQGYGTVNTTSVYIREVTRVALQYNASALFLVHNHPSGVAAPSPADKKLTQMIIQALNIVNVKVADHLIIGNGCYFSFYENNLIPYQNL